MLAAVVEVAMEVLVMASSVVLALPSNLRLQQLPSLSSTCSRRKLACAGRALELREQRAKK